MRHLMPEAFETAWRSVFHQGMSYDPVTLEELGEFVAGLTPPDQAPVSVRFIDRLLGEESDNVLASLLRGTRADTYLRKGADVRRVLVRARDVLSRPPYPAPGGPGSGLKARREPLHRPPGGC